MATIRRTTGRPPEKKRRQAGPVNEAKAFERALRKAETSRYVLRLYVTGSTARSTSAIMNIRKLCEEHLKGRYDLEVIDIYQQPVLAVGEQIIAAPTLIKRLPAPLRKMVGVFADQVKILIGLDLSQRDIAQKIGISP